MGYSVITTLYMLGTVVFVGAFIWHVTSHGMMSDITADIASALALIVVYGLVLVTQNDASAFAQAIGGGLPFVDAIADYGSLKAVFMQDKVKFITSFLDVVVLSGMIDLLKPFLGAGKRVKMSMSKVFAGIVSALIALFILNTVIKTSDVYANVVAFIGSIVSIFSISTMSLSAISALINGRTATTGLLAFAALTMNNPVSNAIRESFFKALVYVIIIWLMEFYCGSLAGGVSFIFNLIVAFAPAVVLIIGLIVILRGLKL